MPTAVDFLFSAPATCDGGECPAVVLNMFGIIDYPRTSEQLAPAAVRFFMIDDAVAPGGHVGDQCAADAGAGFARGNDGRAAGRGGGVGKTCSLRFAIGK
jgi:hypothetical protein